MVLRPSRMKIKSLFRMIIPAVCGWSQGLQSLKNRRKRILVISVAMPLGARINGYVNDVFVSEGQLVRAG